MKCMVMAMGCCFLIGCSYLPFGVAKQADLEAEKKRTDRLEAGMKELGQFSEKNTAQVAELRNRTSALEGNVTGLQAGIATLNTQVASKLDNTQLEASLAAWAARQPQYATTQQLAGVQARVGQIDQRLANKMDRFRVLPVRPSTAIPGAQCLYFFDREVSVWYSWRWQASDPSNSTALLRFQPKQCRCGNCGVWEDIPAQKGLEMVDREKFPVPDHMLNVKKGEDPGLVPMPPPPY